MTIRALVIGLGQAAAGDDAVGFAVLEALGRAGVPDGVQLRPAADASELVMLLSTRAPVVVIDAVIAAPGSVLHVDAGDITRGALASVSTHGISVGQAIALARLLDPEGTTPQIHLVGVGICRPERLGFALSPEVAAAVPRAVERVLDLLGAP